MKKHILFLLCATMLAPLAAQVGERTLNRRYQNEIRDSLADVVLQRQRAMQRYAEQWLIALPNEQKLYDESYISVGADLVDTLHEDGTMSLDLVYRLSYNCKHLEGYTDDYPLGAYDVDSSNSCRAICRLTKHFVENVLGDLFGAGQEVEITISSSADGTEFTNKVTYDGRYGDFRYCPVTFNGERIRISVDRNTAINNNAQLAYIRAQSVRAYLEENIPALHRTHNNFRYVAQSYKDSINTHYYRRSAVEMRVRNVFSETVARMRADKMQDNYVDYNIPHTTQRTPDAYVLVVANEEYGGGLLPDVPYARNDGDIVRQYFVKALGVPDRQVKVLHNASKADIQQEGIHWLQDLAQAVAAKGGDQPVPVADLYIYYAGHGFTDLDGNTYLLPCGVSTDGISSLTAKKSRCKKKKQQQADSSRYDVVLSKKEVSRLAKECLSVEDLCAAFKNSPVKNLTLVIDASFDGHNRDGKPMARADRKLDPKKKKRKANLRSDAVILYAAADDKTAYAFDTYQHGFLTYFLLKEIKSQGDNIFHLTYQDIYESVERNLNKESALQNRWQEAYGLAGGRYKDSWQRLHIKN
ncbi:MAG: caspase family protein [Bacteroidales bacterium]|nr:caspase family protein [Bacteroidales bacterium]